MTELTELTFNKKGEVTNLEGRTVNVIPVGKPLFKNMHRHNYLRVLQHDVPEPADAFIRGDTKVYDNGPITAAQYYKIK